MSNQNNHEIDDLSKTPPILIFENKEFVALSKKEGWFNKEVNIVTAVIFTIALFYIKMADVDPNYVLLTFSGMGIYLSYKFWSNEWRFSTAIDVADLDKEKVKSIPTKQRYQIASVLTLMSFWRFLLAVWFVRFFLFFPVNIPSESMLPTLQVKDYVWVKRYKVLAGEELGRGDLAVFDTLNGVQYIKRVIAKGGDTISIDKDKITINGEEITHHRTNNAEWHRENNYTVAFSNEPTKWNRIPYFMPITDFQGREHCTSKGEHQLECKLPAKSYFVMGDNRDFSNDSRFIGLVYHQQLNGEGVVKNLFKSVDEIETQ